MSYLSHVNSGERICIEIVLQVYSLEERISLCFRHNIYQEGPRFRDM